MTSQRAAPLVSVVVVNYQGASFLPACLSSVRRQTIRDVETIVVDNGSTDGSLQLINREYPWVRAIEAGRNFGFATAVNVGVAKAGGDFVALLNNDAWAENDWLEVCVSALQSSPHVGSCASKVVLDDAPERLDTAGDGFAVAGFGYKVGWLEPARGYDTPRPVFGASAAAAVIRTDAFREAGGFDNDYFIYGEDVDLSFRMQLLGYPCLYLPSAVAHHRVRATVGLGSPLSVYLSNRNSLTTVLKNYPPWLLRRAYGHIIGCTALTTAVLSARGYGLLALRGRRDAVLGGGRLLDKRRAVQARIRIDRARLEELLTWRWLHAKRRIWRAEREFRSWLRAHGTG
jgi:GT2 family glycosyltransferase